MKRPVGVKRESTNRPRKPAKKAKAAAKNASRAKKTASGCDTFIYKGTLSAHSGGILDFLKAWYE
jgi:hypothetical protein